MYTSNSRVLHVNQIAGVPSTLVRQARAEGKRWALKTIPVGRGNPARVVKTRLDDLIQWSRVRSHADIIHVHYAPNGYYGWGDLPFVLHVHGSDIRKDWEKPIFREVITHSLRRADAVLYSTSDLYHHLEKIRPDAVWAPNPVPPEFFEDRPYPPISDQIVFSSRWDDTKGIELLLPLAEKLLEEGFHVTGLDWGENADEARKLGVELHPLMQPAEFSDFLASARLVVGQLKFGTLSMTDYQTLALNRPLVCAANPENPPAIAVSCHGFPGIPRDPIEIARRITEFLRYEDTPQSRDWVLARHHPKVCVDVLEQLYAQLL